MNKKDLFTLKVGLESVSKLQGVKFAYAVAKNLHLIAAEIASLMKSIEPSEEFKAFDKKRIELCNEYAKKTENGKPVIVNSEFMIENRELFDKKLEELRDNHSEEIEAREGQFQEYEEMLNEPCEMTLVKISDKLLPEEINAEQILGIMEIIEPAVGKGKKLKAVK